MDIETVAIDSLRPHPHNYRRHPEEQVEAIAASLKQFGQYRPIVVSSDGYILAGEGVWRGRQKAGCADIDAVRMPFAHDDPRAENRSPTTIDAWRRTTTRGWRAAARDRR